MVCPACAVKGTSGELLMSYSLMKSAWICAACKYAVTLEQMVHYATPMKAFLSEIKDHESWLK